MQYTVKYISNRCSQTDELANKPHESVAKSLMSILQDHDEIKHPVIGVEGSWGSGKSQVINILQGMASRQTSGKKYLFHTYDIWSTQEDLTRRSFLDSLLNFATDINNKNGFKEFKGNTENLTKLNATTTIHSTKTFPVVRLFYGVALLIPISLFLITMVEKFWGYREGAAWSYDELRGCFGIVLTMATIFFFVKDLVSEYQTVATEDKDNKLNKKDRFKSALSRILYLYKGKDIEKEDHETIIKDEPSVSRFRKIFNDLKSSIKDDTVLVIVFDNMDRLSDSSKLMSVWTLLHTFFAEGDNEGKIWAIVPYDKQQLAAIMATSQQTDKEVVATEFLNKTFFTSIHIPEPIMSSWKKFLNEKLDEAFTPAIDSEERITISLIFSRSIRGIIRPRDIIAFVNKLATLYTQHSFEEIPLGILTLYSQIETELRKDPTTVILSHKGHEQFLPLFPSRTELSKQLAAIYYNIEVGKALEVVLGSAITAFLSSDLETDEEFLTEYQKLSNNSAYTDYIEEYFNNPSLALEDLKPENLFFLLKQSNISTNTKRRIYVLVAEAAEDKFKLDFSGYQPWMEWAFINCNLQKTNSLISTILKLSEPTFSDYQNALVELFLLKEQRTDLVIKPKTISVGKVTDMIELYESLSNHDATRLYPNCKITIAPDKLLEFMKEGVSGQQLFGTNTDKVYDLLQLLVNNKYDFKQIKEFINNASVNIPSLDEMSAKRIYKVFDILNPVITQVPSYTAYNTGFKQIPEYYAACIYTVKNSDTNVISACFNNGYERSELIPVLSRYVTLSEMLTMALRLNNNVLYSMCCDLVEYDGVRLGNPSIYFINTKELVSILPEDHFETLIGLLDSEVSTITFNNIFGINTHWIDTISQTSVNEHLIYKRVHELWVEGLNNLPMEQWKSNLNNSSNVYSNITITLDERGLLPDAVYKTSEFMEAVQATLSDYIVSGTSFDSNLYDHWKQHATSSDLAIIANAVKDKITAPNNIPIGRFSIFIKLYVTHSERLKDPAIADSFYDDYLSRYYRECPTDSLVQFTIEANKKISSFIVLCSQERQNQFCGLLQNLYAKVSDEAHAKVKLQSMIDSLKAKEAENH